MAFSSFSFKIGSVLLVGSMLTASWTFFACQHETLMDAAIGVHDGTCHYLDKNLPTGTINADTTYESTIEIIRIDADQVIAKGCGAPLYAFSMPAGSSETEFYSQQSGTNSQNYTFEIWINLLDRTIRTHSLRSGWPTFYHQENTGMFKF